MKRIVGIDYSMTSPSICIGESNTFSDCKVYYLTDLKKCQGVFSNLEGSPHKPWKCDEERYYHISQWLLSKLLPGDILYIEGYSLGSSTGRLFNIAENTGLLKNLLWNNKFAFTSIPPTSIKKFATTKGNATKEKMQEYFLLETQINIKSILNLTEKQWNPSSDIIDSYFIMKMGFDLEKINGA